ncbi:Fic family protein [Marinicellulosiphila megalodicopiae]|uniref:Fic family protein n=1 Tax=Marinicellulosiphila megalodicopiae TaxID=2724896 RepID=UPI003BAE74DD
MSQNNQTRSGSFRKVSAGYTAFFPSHLPPEPSIELSEALQLQLSQADRAVGALNMVLSVLPNPELLTGMLIQKEALLSSQIEGTQSSLVDVLGAEEQNEPTKDVGEVLNYVKAARHGLNRLKKDDMPLCLRIIKEMHEILMQDVRGGMANLTPGEFRTMQNWIGGSKPSNARYVPPPATELLEYLGQFEKYLNDSPQLPPLIQCALIHYQFETLHPFNDGNGRVGRLLITLYLVSQNILEQPVLYLSAYLKIRQQEYYDRLQQVRVEGSYEKWIAFFLEGIEAVSHMVVETTKQVQKIERDDTDKMIAQGAGSEGVNVIRFLLQQPIVQVSDIEKHIGKSRGTATKLINIAEQLGIIEQISKGKRNRKYIYKQYVDILSEGCEL